MTSQGIEQKPDRWKEYQDGVSAYNSFYGQAALVFCLYWALYIPGLVLNVYWIAKCSKARKRVGYPPPGSGCLWLLLLFGMLPLTLFCWLIGILETPAFVEEILPSKSAEVDQP